MNDTHHQLDKLFVTARAVPTDTSRIEFGFETRLLARIRAIKEDEFPWLAVTRRLLPIFAAIVVALGTWHFAESGADDTDLYAAVTAHSDEALLYAALTGE